MKQPKIWRYKWVGRKPWSKSINNDWPKTDSKRTISLNPTLNIAIKLLTILKPRLHSTLPYWQHRTKVSTTRNLENHFLNGHRDSSKRMGTTYSLCTKKTNLSISALDLENSIITPQRLIAYSGTRWAFRSVWKGTIFSLSMQTIVIGSGNWRQRASQNCFNISPWTISLCKNTVWF